MSCLGTSGDFDVALLRQHLLALPSRRRRGREPTSPSGDDVVGHYRLQVCGGGSSDDALDLIRGMARKHSHATYPD